MLNSYHSNDLENLGRLFAETISDTFSQGPEQSQGVRSHEVLLPETVLVQSYGMGRWLKLKLAENFGVSANIRCLLPASFLWEVVRTMVRSVPEVSPFDREVLRWRLVRLLPDLSSRPHYEPVADYLAQDSNGLRLYQLADQIARVFDSYLVYRPGWIRKWEVGEGDDVPADLLWQPSLWRALVDDSKTQYGPGLNHRIEIYDYLQRALLADNPAIEALPSRVSVFGISSLPPQNLNLLNLLARHIDVHFFVFNPCAHYWGDIVDEKRIHSLRERAIHAGKEFDALHYATGNPLLASMGKSGKELVDLLLDCEVHAERSHFIVRECDSVLHLVQHDILELEGGTPETRDELKNLLAQVVEGSDRSITIQVCHSPLREVQVLHDQLLAMFEEMAELRPREIVVMTPDIDKYAPYIEAVFGSVSGKRHIPWALADRSDLERHPLFSVLRWVLGLPDLRATASQLIEILSEQGVQRKFDIDIADLEIIVEWVRIAGIRWGLESASNKTLQYTGVDKNTWDFGLRRLLAGYACSQGESLVLGILPLALTQGSQALALGKLAEFLDVLNRLRDEVCAPHALGDWQGLLSQVTRDLYELDDDDYSAHRELSELLAQIAREAEGALFAEPVHRAVLEEHLLSRLSNESAHQRFLGGDVTFCNLLPMRSVPFRVVCLLGMNDGDFPRIQERQRFDLLSRTVPQRGDRSKRDDDRYLFLEAILSAGERLYISYVGRDPRDNSELLPSALVSELWEYIESTLARSKDEHKDVQNSLVVVHPLQPFSPRYFEKATNFQKTERAPLFSYSSQWLGGSDLKRIVTEPKVANLREGTAEPNRIIELVDLAEFLRNPCKHFFNKTLDVYFDREKEIEDAEPFPANYLERWSLRKEIVDAQLAGGSIAALRLIKGASGQLPIAPFDEVMLDQALEDTCELVSALKSSGFSERSQKQVRVFVSGVTLAGSITGVTPFGLVDYATSKYSIKYVLPIWVKHLTLAACGELAAPSKVYCMDGCCALSVLPVELAQSLLSRLVDIYFAGLENPLAFFPSTSEALCKYLRDRDTTNYSSVRTAFRGARQNPGEANNLYIRRAFQEDDLFLEGGKLHPEMETLAIDILQPLLELLKFEKY